MAGREWFTAQAGNVVQKLTCGWVWALLGCLLTGLFGGESVLAQAPGTLDTAFAPVILGPNNDPGVVHAVALQSDGRIVIGGEFTSVNGSGRSRVARLNADGSLDTGFNPGSGVGGSLFPSVFAVAVQTDGRIVIGGDFSTVNGIGRNNIARLNADGSLDESFNPGTGIGGGIFPVVYTLALQPDGRVVVGGEFTSVNGVGRNNIARLNTNGSLDTSFDPGSGIGGLFPSVQAVAIQSDGRMVVGGDFSTVNGVNRSNIARLNSNGSLDTGFNPGSGPGDTVQAVVVQPDGKVLIAGFFAGVNGVSRGRVARLNADGSLDSGFAGGSGASDVVFELVLQADGRVVIGGDFTSVGGSGRNRIARLAADGSLDATFDPGSGVGSGIVRALALQSNGRVLLGGDFTTVNGASRPSLARLFGGDSGGGGGGCTYAITPSGVVAPAASVTGTVTVTTTAGCAWTATSNVPWVTITSGASGSGAGTVGYSVAANSGPARIGTLTIAGQTFTINQASGCTYAIAPQETTVTADGGSGTVAVATNAGCPWTATSNVAWVTITSGASGSGNGTVGYSVAANSGAARTGTLTIAGQTFTVNQAAGAPGGCLYTVTPTTLNVGGDVVAGTTLTVTTTSNCAWEATVRNIDAPWIKLISAQLPNGQVVTPRMVGELGDVNRRLAISVTGSATLTIGVGRNPGATPRTGTFFVAGQVITVTQAGSSGVGAPVGSTMAMFRPSNGFMYLKNQLISDFADNDFFYGVAGDAPLAGDWDGDGIDTPGIYRNVNGVMTFFLINNNTGGFADVSFAFGQPGDVPLAGDWDGNGTVTCGVYRPSAQTFFLRNTNTAGNPDVTVEITGAQATDVPIAGRWTVTSNVTGLGLYRPGTGQFFLKNANVSGLPDVVLTMTTSGTVVRPVAGDWTRQGFAAVGVVVNLGGTIQFQLRTSNTSGGPDIRVNYGVPGDIPLIGNWDGQPKPPPVSVP